MKNRIISLLLAVCLTISFIPVSYADEKDLSPSYYTMNSMIIGVPGGFCDLDYMIPADHSGVYVNAEDFSKITGLSGYKYDQTYTQCAYVNAESNHAVLFQLGAKNVVAYVMGSCLSYEAPLKALMVDGVTWVPFDFAAKMLGMKYYVKGREIIIYQPEMTPMVVASHVRNNADELSFDWVNEQNYTPEMAATLPAQARTLNFMNGLMSQDFGAWGTLITSPVMGDALYEKQFAEQIALAFVSPSRMEFEFTSERLKEESKYLSSGVSLPVGTQSGIGDVIDHLENGDIVKALDLFESLYPQIADDPTFFEISDNLRQNAKDISGKNGPVALIAKNSESVIDEIEKASNFIGVLEYAVYLIEAVNYVVQFNIRDENAVKALRIYADYSKGDEAPIFKLYSKQSTNPTADALVACFMENTDELAGGLLPFDDIFGSLGSAVFLGWDIASSYYPPLVKMLENAENTELTTYAMSYQDKSERLINQKRVDCYGENSVKKEGLDDLRYATYAFLDFCLVARSFACDVLDGTDRTDEAKEAFRYGMDKLNYNTIKYMTLLLNEDVGFTPEDNGKYNSNWKKTRDSELISVITQYATPIEASSQNTVPKNEEVSLTPGMDNFYITEEEAIELVEDSVSSMMWGMGDMFIGKLMTFSVIGNDFSAKKQLPTYVISMNIIAGENGEMQQQEMFFFVPIDGTEVWIGAPDTSGQFGEYMVFTAIDFANFSMLSLTTKFSEIILSIAFEEMRAEGQDVPELPFMKDYTEYIE